MPDDVVASIEAGNEDLLIGEPETEHVDFKEQPYLLATDKGKWELAKDVAALANSGGGCLVIGVATTTPADREEEIASEIKPFPVAMVDLQQMRTTIDAASGVYPVLKRVDIRRFDRTGGKALAVVRVPEQDEDDLPFMVVRMVEGNEKRGVGVGVPLRSGPHTFWVPPGQLHRDLSDGRRARQTLPQPTTEDVTSAPAESVRARADEQLDTLEQFMGWGEAATLMLAVVPTRLQESPIDGLYDPNRIYGCVQTPPQIRHAGFGLAYPHEPENIHGALVNATSERQVLWVSPDGATFAGAVGLQSFLTRSGGSRSAQSPEPRIINPTVLVEWTYLFFKFVDECLKSSIEGSLRAVVQLRGAQTRAWPLRMVAGSTVDFWRDGQAAGMDDLYAELDVTQDPGRDAFSALARIYALFGLASTAIPFSAGDRVDESLIQAIG